MSLHLHLPVPLLTRVPRKVSRTRRGGRAAYRTGFKDYSPLPVCGQSVRPLASQVALRAVPLAGYRPGYPTGSAGTTATSAG